MSLADRIPIFAAQRAMAMQAARYAFAGIIITLLVAASYWAIAELLHVDPMVSLTIVFVCFTLVSYVTHGAFTFRGHGARDRHHVRVSRFFLVNIIGFAINQFFVWLLVKHLGGPTWWPMVPMVFVTPLLTFVLNRKWVYS
jgi:putative flippase GtrA